MWIVRSMYFKSQPKSDCHLYATNFTRTSCTYTHRDRYGTSAPVQTMKWTIKLDLRGYKWPFILHPLYASHALFFIHILSLGVCAFFFVDDFTLSTAHKIYIYLCVCVWQSRTLNTLTGRQTYAKGRINISWYFHRLRSFLLLRANLNIYWMLCATER